MSNVDDIARLFDLSERLRARGRDDLADRLLGRVITEIGEELARRDPRVRSMLDLDAELARLAVARLEPSDAALVRRRGEDG